VAYTDSYNADPVGLRSGSTQGVERVTDIGNPDYAVQCTGLDYNGGDGDIYLATWYVDWTMTPGVDDGGYPGPSYGGYAVVGCTEYAFDCYFDEDYYAWWVDVEADFGFEDAYTVVARLNRTSPASARGFNLVMYPETTVTGPNVYFKLEWWDGATSAWQETVSAAFAKATFFNAWVRVALRWTPPSTPTTADGSVTVTFDSTTILSLSNVCPVVRGYVPSKGVGAVAYLKDMINGYEHGTYGFPGIVDNLYLGPCRTSAFYDCGRPDDGHPDLVPEDLCDKRLVYAYLEWDVTDSTTVTYES
jgi:hypothetical protein